MKQYFSKSPWKLAIDTGILGGLAYPPVFGLLAWFAWIPLIHIWLTSAPRNAAKYSYMAGVVTHLIAFYWIGLNQGAGWLRVLASLIGTILYLSLFWSITGYLVAWLEKKSGCGLQIIPFLWVTMELARSWGPLGFPWANLATTQAPYLPVVQMVEVTGTVGIGFWIMLVNIGLYLVFRSTTAERKHLSIALLLIFFLPWIVGNLRLSALERSGSPQTRTVAILQPNIDPNQKWESDFRPHLYAIMDSLHQMAVKAKPDLILWPEAALPVNLRLASYHRKPLEKTVKDSGIPVLIGTVDWERTATGEKTYYNGSIYLSPEGITMYHKVQLVPFAEYIPLSEIFPRLKELNIGQANFTHGSDYTLFNLDSVKFSNVICYESSSPQVVRQFFRKTARFLTIESNDAWSGNTSGVYQHFQIARLRAIEMRSGIARSANTGISGFIAPTGAVSARLPYGKQGILVNQVELNQTLTFYARYGEIFGFLCFLVVLIFTGRIWFKKSS